MLWIDKYRPASLSTLDVHTALTPRLAALARASDFPHLLFYGPAGAGKKTRISCVLRELFGAAAQKVKVEHKSITVNPNSNKKIDVETIASNFHIEINPSESGLYDRYVVSEMVKEIAQSAPISGDSGSSRGFKVVVLHQVDRMSREAQQALRRMMEKYMRTCRMILCCESLSRVIEPLHSRCLPIRIANPSTEELTGLLQSIAKREGMKDDGTMVRQAAEKSNGDMQLAVLMLEAAKMVGKVELPDWMLYLQDTAKKIVDKQNAQTVLEVRERLFELLTNCVPADVILVQLTKSLLEKCDHGLKPRVLQLAAKMDQRLRKGQKAIMHLEAFVVGFMAEYKSYLAQDAEMLDAADLDF